MPTTEQIAQTGDSLAGIRQRVISAIMQANSMRGYYDHKPYSRAHLRKVAALGEEILSELDFVEFAYKEGR